MWNSKGLTQILTGHTEKASWSLGKYLVTPPNGSMQEATKGYEQVIFHVPSSSPEASGSSFSPLPDWAQDFG